ncbi:MAG TPA: IclR family transcriptional regulator C-terminal domain-containing protein [Burkholderiales bacterium]|nr:IclR family transcriptional regulator C-terminal domain-containing protein [Burkholderiales bacterium]
MRHGARVESAARSGTQSIERAFALLGEIGAANASGARLPDLAGRLQLNRTTVHRLLKCLVAQGALRLDAASKRYFLGPLMRDLHAAARQPLDVKGLLAPMLTRVAEATGDTVFLLLRSGNDSICIDRRLGSYPVKTLVVDVGTRRPLGIGVAGLAILSALPEQELQRVVRENADRVAAFDTSAAALLRAARAARRAGHASGPVHRVDGVSAIALPIRAANGSAVAALAVAAIASRMKAPRRAELVGIVRAELARFGELPGDASVASERE